MLQSLFDVRPQGRAIWEQLDHRSAVQDRQQQMLGADVGMPERGRFLLRKLQNPPRSTVESIECVRFSRNMNTRVPACARRERRSSSSGSESGRSSSDRRSSRAVRIAFMTGGIIEHVFVGANGPSVSSSGHSGRSPVRDGA